MPVINCPACGLVWRTADRDGAYTVQCHDCGSKVQVNTPSSTERMPRSRPQPVQPAPAPPPFEDTRTMREAPPPPPVATQPRERPRPRPRRGGRGESQGSSFGIVLVILSMGFAALMVVGVIVWLAWLTPTESEAPDATKVASAKSEPPRAEPPKAPQPAKENPPRQREPAPPKENPPRQREPAPARDIPRRPRNPAPPPQEPEKLTDDATFNKAFDDLKSPDAFHRQRGADLLCKVPPNEKREEVVKLLLPMLEDANGWPRNAGIQALGYWGTKDNGPALMKLLDHPDVWTRWTAMVAVGRLQYDPAAPVLAERMTVGRDRGKAVEALKLIGPAAEKPLLQQIDHKDVFRCREICDILKEIGTKESLPKLDEMIATDNIHIRVHVRPHAEAALAAIKQREMK